MLLARLILALAATLSAAAPTVIDNIERRSPAPAPDPHPGPEPEPEPEPEPFHPMPDPAPNPNANSPRKRGYWQNEFYVGYATQHGLNCRSCASTDCPAQSQYNIREPVVITCQTYGQNVDGITLWDKTDRGCFVSDGIVKTYMARLDGVPGCD